jgi:hypothetical protein
MQPAAADQKGQFLDVTGSHTYGTLRDGLPIIERVERRFRLTSSASETVSTTAYRYDEKIPSESEFRLPKYGLPEPFGFTRPTPWYLWAIAAAAVLFIAGAVLRRLASRRAAAVR